MKRRTLLLVLILAAVTILLAVTVAAEKATAPAVCPQCRQPVVWTGLSTVPDDAEELAAGHYYYDYAEAFHSFTAVKEIGSKVCLYLPDGRTLSGPNRVFSVNSTGELSMMGEGILAGIGYTEHESGGTIRVDGGTFNLLGGTLTTQLGAGRFVYQGGVVYMRGGKFNMSGGTIRDGATDSALGNTNGAKGGNICLAGRAVMTMTEGSVENGSVTGNSYGSGGNIYINADAALVMSGGSITGGSAKVSGTQCINNRGLVTVTGDAVIENLRLNPTSDKTIGDLFAVSGVYTGSVRLNILDNQAGVGVALGQLKDNGDIRGGEIVICDIYNQPLAYEPQVSGEQIIMSSVTREAYCEACGKTVTWNRLSEKHADAEAIAEGHYYLFFREQKAVWETKTISGKVCLDLNGMDIQGKNRLFTIAGDATLSIQGEGTVIGGGFAPDAANADRSGGVAYVPAGATLNIYGGVYETELFNEDDLASFNGGAFWCQGSMNVYDATINGEATNTGGSIFLQTKGALYLYGGVCNGNIYAKAPVYVANDVYIEDVSLKTNQLTIEGVYTGYMKLNISNAADGLVIGSSKNANLRYAEFWVAGFRDKLFVTAEDNQLKLTKFQPIYIRNVQNRYCSACGEKCDFVELTEQDATGFTWKGGHYYLNFENGSAEFATGQITTTDRVCLDLNGCTLIGKGRAFEVGKRSVLNVMDSKGGGTVCGQMTMSGGAFYVSAGGSLNLYGGTHTVQKAENSETLSVKGGVIYALGEVTIYGGTVTGGYAQVGGNIYVDATKDGVGTFRMYGGSVTNGTATTGHCVIFRGYAVLGGDAQIDQLRRTTSDYSPATGECLTIDGDFTGAVELFYPAGTNGMDIGNLKNADFSSANIRFGLMKNATVKANNNDLLAIVGDPAAVIYNADGTTAAYNDLDSAIVAFDGVKILLLKNAGDVIAVKDAYIDLNGCSITGSVTGEGTLYVMDSKTADFTVADSVYGTVTRASNVKPVAQGAACSEDGYLMISEGNAVSFHRITLRVKSMSLRSANAGLYFKCVFAGDEMVRERVTSFGVALNVMGDPIAQEYADATIITNTDKTEFGVGVTNTSVLVYGIMKDGKSDAANAERAAMQIYGRAYVRIGEDYIYGTCRNRSLVEQCAGVNSAWSGLDLVQKRTFMDMFYQFESVMRGAGWAVSNAVSVADRKAVFENTDYTPYLAPWTADEIAKAKTDGKIHYYFMSGEGLPCDVVADMEERWGDSCLVVFPNGQTMLIDAGPLDYAPVLLRNLERMGITHLDYVLISHPHSDHQGGIFHEAAILNVGLVDKISVGKIYYRGGYDTSYDTVDDNAFSAPRVAAEYGIPFEILRKGDNVQVGDVKLEVLWPAAGYEDAPISGTEEMNNFSVVVRIDFGEHSALYTGDLYASGEMQILEQVDHTLLDVDFMKVPHHGYLSSSSAPFLRTISPEMAVCTGRLNVSDEMRNRYQEYDIQMLDDWTYGYIHITADAATGELVAETSRTEFNGNAD